MFIAFCMRSTVSIYNLARACSIYAICRCQQLRLKIGILNSVIENNNVMCAFEMKKSSYRRLSFICAFTKKNFFCCIGIIIHTTKHTEEHSWVSNEKTTTTEATDDDEYDDGGTESLFIFTIAKFMSCIYCHRLPLLIKSHQKL